MGGICSRDRGAENPYRKVLSENVRRGDVLGDILVLNLNVRQKIGKLIVNVT